MKTSYFFAPLLAVACATAFAQAPTSGTPRPPSEVDATKSGGKAAEKAEMKTDAKKGAGMKAMDTNGDGMVSKAEWDAYHAGTWGKFNQKNGMVSMMDIEKSMGRDGPN
jgi:hypothetical protein